MYFPLLCDLVERMMTSKETDVLVSLRKWLKYFVREVEAFGEDKQELSMAFKKKIIMNWRYFGITDNVWKPGKHLLHPTPFQTFCLTLTRFIVFYCCLYCYWSFSVQVWNKLSAFPLFVLLFLVTFLLRIFQLTAAQ